MLTFHKMIAGCEAGDAGAWRDFIADYSPAFLALTRIYLPGAAPEEPWKAALSDVSSNGYAALRAFERQSEREFLGGLRVYYLRRSAPVLDAGRDATNGPELDSTSLAAILKGVPLVHQEVVFLKLAGYSDGTLEQIFRITPSVAASSLERLKPMYGSVLGRKADEGWQPGAWLARLGELWSAQSDVCPPLRLLIRIQDGQIGWQEKEPAEKHIAECLHCLERWTALRELGYWRSAAPGVASDQIENLIAAIPVREEPGKRKPLLKRLFG